MIGLAEVAEILAPSTWNGSAARHDAGVFRFVAVPPSREPSLLLPADSAHGAATAVRRWSQGTGPARAALGRAAALGLETGVARRPFVRAIGTGDGPLPLIHHLSELLGQELTIAVRMRSHRPNSKAVLLLLSRAGDLLGYAKIGSNPLTQGLVRNEAAVLTRLAQDDDDRRLFDAPTVLHHGTWHGSELLVVSPLEVNSWARPDPAREVMRQIAGLQPLDLQPLATSDYWRQVTRRVAALPTDQASAAAVRSVVDEMSAAVGDQRLLFGDWHGDWTPGNLSSLGERYSVWDWERSSGCAPVGLDAGYFFVRAGGRRRRLDDSGLATTVRRLTPLISDLGQASRHAGLLVLLAVLETALRFEEARTTYVELGNRSLPLLAHATTLVPELGGRPPAQAGPHAA